MSAPIFSLLPIHEGLALCKLADADGQTRAMKPWLAGMLGMGAGTLVGAGAAHLANKTHQHFTGKSIPSSHLLAAVPILGGGLGLAYNLAQAHQAEETRRAREGSENRSHGRLPGE